MASEIWMIFWKKSEGGGGSSPPNQKKSLQIYKREVRGSVSVGGFVIAEGPTCTKAKLIRPDVYQARRARRPWIT